MALYEKEDNANVKEEGPNVFCSHPPATIANIITPSLWYNKKTVSSTPRYDKSNPAAKVSVSFKCIICYDVMEIKYVVTSCAEALLCVMFAGKEIYPIIP